MLGRIGGLMSRHVLICDDNRDLLRFLALEVSAASEWRVLPAENAAEARHLLRIHRIDAALIDYHLGGESGLDLAREVREALPEASITLMSGASQQLKGEIEACG